MNKIHLVTANCLLLTIFPVGCDFSDNNISDKVKKTDTGSTPTTAPATPAESIDLSISPAMIEQQEQEKDFLAPSEIPSTSFNDPPKESDVSFSGKLHLDDSEDDYPDAIEGAEINIEVKFK